MVNMQKGIGAVYVAESQAANVHAEVEHTLRTIFRRCVICPPGAPSCPLCASGETCSLQAESCTACASTTCVPIGSLPGQAAPSRSPPVGAIAGGVIAGVLSIAVLTFLVWRFCIRNKRRQYDQAFEDQRVEKRDLSTLARNDRQSTAASIASTVLTRASNVIQIAYIPGVTNRSPPDSPAFIPPMPPMPFGTPGSSTVSSPNLEQHFFMPGDLRDSTYSHMSEEQRFSLAPSLARSSVATTIYPNDAIVPPIPAQQAFRARPGVVTVKPGTSGSGSSAPPMPQLPNNIHGSSIVARNVVARPIKVKKPASGTNVPTLANLAQASSTRDSTGLAKPKTAATKDIYEEKEVLVASRTDNNGQTMAAHKSMSSKDTGSTSGISTILPSQGPLRDPSGGAVTHRHTSSTGLNAMIEDAMNKAARDPTHMRLGGRPELRKQDSGPFSDSHEIKENLL